MELKLKKPLAFFDLETTGINISADRIVEISILKVLPNAEEQYIRSGLIRLCLFLQNHPCSMVSMTKIL